MLLGASTGVVSAVACWGNAPSNSWPFKLGTEAISDDDRIPHGDEAYQLTTLSMANLNAPFDADAMATDPAYRREVPITPDAARVLAAALGGTVATEAQVGAAAAAGAAWEQLGLTQNERHATSWVSMVGTAPQEGTGAVVRNAVKVFDGGARALGAVNVFGPKLTAAQAHALNAGGVFLIRPWNNTAWSRISGRNTSWNGHSVPLKTDDRVVGHASVVSPVIERTSSSYGHNLHTSRAGLLAPLPAALLDVRAFGAVGDGPH